MNRLPIDVVCFSWEPWDPKTRKRTVPLLLAWLEFQPTRRVLYVNHPFYLIQWLRGQHPKYMREIIKFVWPKREGKVTVFTPLYPFPGRFRRLNGAFARCQLRALKSFFGLGRYVYFNVCPFESEIDSAFHDAAVYILDMYDDYESMVTNEERSRIRGKLIAAAVTDAARRAQHVTAVTPALAERARERGAAAASVLRNGMDFDNFVTARRNRVPPPPALAKLPRPIIGFMGQIDPRLNFDLLEFLSWQRKNWSFVLLGPITAPHAVPDSIRKVPNVRFLPPVPVQQLPDYLLHFDAGIVPYHVNEFTRRIDSLKVYNYLAAGLPTVTTHVGGIEAFGDLVRVADDPAKFLEQIEQAMATNDDGQVRRRLAYAQRNSWEQRGIDLEDVVTPLLQALQAGSKSRPATSRTVIPKSDERASAGSISTSLASQFVCPNCVGALDEIGQMLVCGSCKRQFPLVSDVPNFAKPSDYYYGEFPQDEMRRLVETAARQGSEAAFKQALAGKTDEWRRYFLQYAEDETRAAWQFLLHLPENASVLDFGCGWGNLALSLARNFGTVFAMDLVPERAGISAIRARECGLQNVIGLAGGNTPHLPFPDQSLDAVVLNGVLEWVGTSFPQVPNPRDAQLQVLRDIVRVLKPDGQVYIGIENRAGFGYFLGQPDEHSKLRFATLIPRWLANWYSVAKRGEAYRTYTYTWRGYRKLLREAGFADAAFFCPFPEYREFKYLINLEKARHIERALQPTSRFGRFALQICRSANVFREVCPSYSIIGSKSVESDPFATRLLHNLGVQNHEAYHLQITGTATALLFSSGLVLRLPLTARAETRMKLEAANLKRIHLLYPSLLPEIIADGQFQRQAFLATHYIDGVPGSRFLVERRYLANALRTAAAFLIDFNCRTQREQTCTEEWLTRSCHSVIGIVASLGTPIDPLIDESRRDLLGTTVVNVVAHGDFSLQNLILNRDGSQLQGVVDWDLTTMNGWPLTGLLHLLTAAEYEIKDTIVNVALLAILKKICQGRGIEHELLERYLTAFRLEPNQVVWAVQLYLLGCIRDKYVYGDRNVGPLLKNLPDDLAQARTLTREWLNTRQLNKRVQGAAKAS